MTQMKPETGYRVLVASIPSFIVGYFLIAAVPALFGIGSGSEKYLFYHWLVFTYVPSREEIDYEAQLVSLQGKAVAPSPLIDAHVLLSDTERNRPFYVGEFRGLGSLLAASSTEVSADRRRIEAYITKRPLIYEVVETRYNPIDHFLHGTVLSRRVLGVFEVQ